MYYIQPTKGICGDICKPLIDLWVQIRDNPEVVSEEYKCRWDKLQKEGSDVYYEIRDDFNKNQSPFDFLFLTRTCANGLIRFNQNGEFNNSFHITRNGINPETLTKIIMDWSLHIKNTLFYSNDYHATTESAKSGDIIYLDPPYFHSKGQYYGKIQFDDFIKYLEDLNRRNIKYILSFDGKREDKTYTVDIPSELYKRHELLQFGNSTFKKVMDKKTEKVFESLYMNF